MSVNVRGFVVGLGAKFFQTVNGWDFCSKWLHGLCVDPYDDTTLHRDCCKHGPCTLCLELEKDDGEIVRGTAVWDGANGWTGSVCTKSVYVYFDVGDADSPDYNGKTQCVLRVDIDGEQQYQAYRCAGTESDWTCTDIHATLTVPSADYDDDCAGTLTVEAFTARRLARDPGLDFPYGEKCASRFCANTDSECTCDEICVSVVTTDADGLAICEGFGRLPFTGVECQDVTTSPEWSGSVTCGTDALDVEISIGHDDYGNCIIGGTVTGGECPVDLENKIVDPNRETMVVEWVVDGYECITTVTVSCAGCEDCGGVTVDCCVNPLPFTLYCDITSTPQGPPPTGDDCGCATGDTIALSWVAAETQWKSGLLPWECPTKDLPGFPVTWQVRLVCISSVWFLFIEGFDEDDNTAFSGQLQAFSSQCEPLELEFEAIGGGGDPVFGGICQPGLIPSLETATVTE